MGRLKIRYLVAKPNRNGGVRYYWQPKTELRRHGFLPRRLADDLATAVRQAERLNAELDAWRRGAARETVQPDSVGALIRLYQRSDDYRALAPSSQRVYDYACRAIDGWCGDIPVRGLTRRAIREWIVEQRDARGTAAARFIRTIFSNLMNYAADLGWREDNPLLTPAPITIKPRSTDRRHPKHVWPRAAVRAFVEAADDLGLHSLGTGILVNEWAGQRPCDLLRMPMPRAGQDTITIRQSKRGATVMLPIGTVPHLVERIEREHRRRVQHGISATTLVVSERTGAPYTVNGAWSAFCRIREHVAKKTAAFPAEPGSDRLVPTAELTLRTLRDTAVVRLFEAFGETADPSSAIAQICAITGHGFGAAQDILSAHYYHRTEKLARIAFRRRLRAEDRE